MIIRVLIVLSVFSFSFSQSVKIRGNLYNSKSILDIAKELKTPTTAFAENIKDKWIIIRLANGRRYYIRQDQLITINDIPRSEYFHTHNEYVKTGRAKIGYSGTYSNGYSVNGFVVGGGGVGGSGWYIGGDVSLEFGKKSTTYDTNEYSEMNIHSIITTPSIVLGYKYIRLRVGSAIYSYKIKGDVVSAYNTGYTKITYDDVYVGVSLGAQFKIPIKYTFGIFIEPGVVIYDGTGAFSLKTGIDF